MNRLKQDLVIAKVIASLLVRILTGPLALLTELFFVIFLGGLVALVFQLGFPKRLLWQLPLPILIVCAALAARILWNRQPVANPKPRQNSAEDMNVASQGNRAGRHKRRVVGQL